MKLNQLHKNEIEKNEFINLAERCILNAPRALQREMNSTGQETEEEALEN